MIPKFVPPFVLSTLLFATVMAAPMRAQTLPESQSPSPAMACADAFPQPLNIHVDPLLQPLVAALLEKSPTLRRQWQTIGAARIVRVWVVATPVLRETQSARARTQFTRYTFGAIRAVVELPGGMDITELLPHELEHVIEQIEGLDLPALAQKRESGVDQVSGGVFETSRARNAGLLALQEVYGEVDSALPAALRGLKRAWKAIAPNNDEAAAPPGPRRAVPGGHPAHKH